MLSPQYTGCSRMACGSLRRRSPTPRPQKKYPHTQKIIPQKFGRPSLDASEQSSSGPTQQLAQSTLRSNDALNRRGYCWIHCAGVLQMARLPLALFGPASGQKVQQVCGKSGDSLVNLQQIRVSGCLRERTLFSAMRQPATSAMTCISLVRQYRKA